jgi:hypothetical protein
MTAARIRIARTASPAILLAVMILVLPTRNQYGVAVTVVVSTIVIMRSNAWPVAMESASRAGGRTARLVRQTVRVHTHNAANPARAWQRTHVRATIYVPKEDGCHIAETV